MMRGSQACEEPGEQSSNQNEREEKKLSELEDFQRNMCDVSILMYTSTVRYFLSSSHMRSTDKRHQKQ